MLFFKRFCIVAGISLFLLISYGLFQLSKNIIRNHPYIEYMQIDRNISTNDNNSSNLTLKDLVDAVKDDGTDVKDAIAKSNYLMYQLNYDVDGTTVGHTTEGDYIVICYDIKGVRYNLKWGKDLDNKLLLREFLSDKELNSETKGILYSYFSLIRENTREGVYGLIYAQ